MKIYKLSQIQTDQIDQIDQETVLFDFCIAMAENSSAYKEEWMKRAEQVSNGEITDEFFAMWLGRRRDDENFGELAGKLADEYFVKNQ